MSTTTERKGFRAEAQALGITISKMEGAGRWLLQKDGQTWEAFQVYYPADGWYWILVEFETQKGDFDPFFTLTRALQAFAYMVEHPEG